MTNQPPCRLPGENWRRAYQARSSSALSGRGSRNSSLETRLSGAFFFLAQWTRLQRFPSSLPNRQCSSSFSLQSAIGNLKSAILFNRQSAIGNRQFSSAFTLIEVLAVLLIFMVLLGMVLVPASRWHRQQRIRSGIAVLQSTLRLAREYAMTRQENVSVTFVNQTDPRGVLRSYFWVEGPTGDMTFTNALPNGVAFYTDTFHSTNGRDHVDNTYTYGFTPYFHSAVLVAEENDDEGDWVVFYTNDMLDSITFNANGTLTDLNRIGIAESDPPGNGLAMTGLLTVTPTTGYITTAPTLP